MQINFIVFITGFNGRRHRVFYFNFSFFFFVLSYFTKSKRIWAEESSRLLIFAFKLNDTHSATDKPTQQIAKKRAYEN